MKLEEMSRDERSLLLYFESCAVDYIGRVNLIRTNPQDRKIIVLWEKSNFIKFGRVKFGDHNSQGGHWVELSEEAWALAHQERKARFNRNTRNYKRTGEE